jgi:hypothetical protein
VTSGHVRTTGLDRALFGPSGRHWMRDGASCWWPPETARWRPKVPNLRLPLTVVGLGASVLWKWLRTILCEYVGSLTGSRCPRRAAPGCHCSGYRVAALGAAWGCNPPIAKRSQWTDGPTSRLRPLPYGPTALPARRRPHRLRPGCFTVPRQSEFMGSRRTGRFE